MVTYTVVVRVPYMKTVNYEKVLEDPKVAASIANVKKAYEGLEALQKRQSAAVKEQVIEGLRVKSTHAATSKKKMGATWTRVKRDHI